MVLASISVKILFQEKCLSSFKFLKPRTIFSFQTLLPFLSAIHEIEGSRFSYDVEHYANPSISFLSNCYFFPFIYLAEPKKPNPKYIFEKFTASRQKVSGEEHVISLRRGTLIPE
jgi:hypothetical protein